MITIRQYTKHAEAALLQSFLQANGIDAVLADEHAAAWVRAPLLVPIRVQVRDEQAEEATALLSSLENQSASAPSQADAE